MSVKTYYIPTTSLNLINILSSESISPAAFYPLRQFGIPSWEKIEHNPLDNAIALYANKFKFSRAESDLQDFPIWIQVQADDASLFVISEEISLCRQTIYLKPENTEITCLRQSDARSVKAMLMASFEVKKCDDYVQKVNAQTIKKSSPDIVWSKYEQELDTESLEQDILINTNKGFLMGWAIGHLLSTDSKRLALRKVLKKVQNLDPIRQRPLLQDGLNIYYQSIENTLYRHLEPLLTNKTDFWECLYLISQIKKSDYYEQRQLLEQTYKVFDSKLQNLNNSDIILNLFQETCRNILQTNVIELALLEKKFKNPNDLIPFIKSSYSNLKELDIWYPGVSTSLEKWVNEKRSNLFQESFHVQLKTLAQQMNQVYQSDDGLLSLNCVPNQWLFHCLCQLLSSGSSLTIDQITQEIKKEYLSDQHQWDGSILQKEINQLRKTVPNELPNMNWQGNALLTALAVNLVKKDWTEIWGFTEEYELFDLRFIFGFYGLIHGYSYLNKHFLKFLNALDEPTKQSLYTCLQKIDPPLIRQKLETTTICSTSVCSECEQNEELFSLTP